MRVLPLLLLASISSPLLADDNLFTGTDQDAYEKRAAKFDVSRWNHVVAASEAQPLKIPATSRTTKQVDTEYFDWLQKNLGEKALAESKGEANEEKLKILVRNTLLWLAELPMEVTNLGPEAIAVEKSATRRPYLDFLAACTLMVIDKEAEGGRLLALTAENQDLPIEWRFAAQARLAQDAKKMRRGNFKEVEKRYWELLQEYAAGPIGEAEAAQHLRGLLQPAMKPLWLDNEDRHVKLFQEAKWPEWMRLTATAELECCQAWRLNEAYWMGKLRDRSGMKQHFQAAMAAAKAAWKLQPDSPGAAKAMMEVCMTGCGDEGDSLRQWFERSLAAQCDRPQTFKLFLSASRPRWGGSYEEMLAIGRACALTKRDDTDLTTIFNQAVLEIACDLEDSHALFHQPDLARLLLETRRARLAKTIGTKEEASQRAWLLIESYWVGDFESAIQEMGWFQEGNRWSEYARVAPYPASKTGLDFMQIFFELECQASPLRANWEKARAQAAAGRYGEAAETLKAVLDKTEPPKTGGMFKTAIALYQFAADYQKGDWTHWPVENRFDWRLLNGVVQATPDKKRLRVTSTQDYGRLLHRAALGTHFELRGKFHVSTRPQRGGVIFYFGHPAPWHGSGNFGWWSIRVDNIRDDENWAGFMPAWRLAPPPSRVVIPAKEESEFLLQRDGDQVSFTVDGKLVFTKELPPDTTGEEESFGLGVVSAVKGAYAEYWDLEVRKLPADQKPAKPPRP